MVVIEETTASGGVGIRVAVTTSSFNRVVSCTSWALVAVGSVSAAANRHEIRSRMGSS
jgi:hypothetical protein